MRTTLYVLLILALVCCSQKAERDVTSSNHDSIEDIKLQRTADSDDAFITEWVLQLSCDGSIVCNACPMVLFKKDGLGIINANGLLITNFKWESKEGRLTIVNSSSESLIGGGEYNFAFKRNGESVGLRLIEINNGNCYQLYTSIDKR
jgi:hypothetical protein